MNSRRKRRVLKMGAAAAMSTALMVPMASSASAATTTNNPSPSAPDPTTQSSSLGNLQLLSGVLGPMLALEPLIQEVTLEETAHPLTIPVPTLMTVPPDLWAKTCIPGNSRCAVLGDTSTAAQDECNMQASLYNLRVEIEAAIATINGIANTSPFQGQASCVMFPIPTEAAPGQPSEAQSFLDVQL